MIRRFLQTASKKRLQILRRFSTNQPDPSKGELKPGDKITIKGKEYEIQEEPERFGKPYGEYVKDYEEKKKMIEIATMKAQDIDPTEPFKVQPRKLLDRNKELDIAQFKLQKPDEYYDNQVKSRPKGVFDFAAPELIEKKGSIMIEGFTDEGFTIGKVDFIGSLVIFRKQIFIWDVHTAEDVRPHNFEIINLIKPRPSKKK